MESNAEPAVRALPGPSLMLRVLLKRPRPAQTGAAAALHARFVVAGLDQAHLARYRQAFGFVPGRVPLTYYYLLSQRAQLATLLAPAFPHRIAGMVHLDNTLTAHADAVRGQAILLHCSVTGLPPTRSNALLYVIETQAYCGGAPLFTCLSTYLAVRGQRSAAAPVAPAAPAGAPLGHWTLNSASGRRYAWLSGDWNPIHLGHWPARLLGLRAPVIHGMHTAAHACAGLEAASAHQVTTLSIAFRAALVLGASVQLRRGLGAAAYGVWHAGVLVADGHFVLAADGKN